MKFTLAIAFSLISGLAFAQNTPAPIQFKKDDKAQAQLAQVLKSVTFFGTTFLPDVHCNTQTVDNPDQLEVFQVPGKDTTIVLCPGSLDGEENTVTVFSKSHAPLISKIRAPISSSRVTDDQIRDLLLKSETRPAPAVTETQDYYKIASLEFDSCLRAAKKQQPGDYVGETFSKATSNRGMFEAMTLYACVAGDRVLFNPQNRVQMVYSSVKIGWLNAACAKNKKTIDIPDVVPQPQASHVMVVKCSLLTALLNPVAK